MDKKANIEKVNAQLDKDVVNELLRMTLSGPIDEKDWTKMPRHRRPSSRPDKESLPGPRASPPVVEAEKPKG